MAEIELEAKSFSRHMKNIYDRWNKNGEWDGVPCDALSFTWGKSEDLQALPVSVHCYLFQYEMPETAIVLTQNKFFFLAGPKKVELVTKMKQSPDYACPVEVVLLTKQKDNSALFDQIKEGIKSSFKGGKVGVLNDPSEGAFINNWNDIITNFDRVDVAAQVSRLMAVKDEQEVKCITTASSITSAIMKTKFVTQIENLIDESKMDPMPDISAYINEFYEKPEKISSKLNPSVVDRIFDASIQSGGVYDLSPSPIVGTGPLQADCVILQLGTRYKSYCSRVSRTLLIDAKPAVTSQYGFLVDLYQKVFDLLHPDTEFSHVYNSALKFIKESKHKGLVANFLPDLGCSMGLQLQDNEFVINATNRNVLKPNMVLHYRIGFNDLVHGGKKYCLFLSDTVLITEDGPKLLTQVKKGTKDVVYNLGSGSSEEEEEPEEKKKPKKKATSKTAEELAEEKEKKNKTKQLLDAKAAAKKKKLEEDRGDDDDEERMDVDEEDGGGVATRMKSRRKDNVTDEAKQGAETKRKEHQKALARQQREDALQKYGEGDAVEQDQPKRLKEYTAYKSHNQFPLDAPSDKLFVDPERESVLVPIHGALVPFHITTIRSTTKTEEHLRIIFRAPGTGAGSAETFVDPKATFIKEMTYHMPNQRDLANAHRLINELKKRVTARESAKSIAEDVPVQENLIKSATPGARLVNLNIRPTLGGGRKTLGTLEAHENGFRFTTSKKGVVDIIYSNIKYAFFQPAESELIVLLHMHLRHPIIIGKKKTVDVQFYTEAMEGSTALHQRSAWGDQDEIEEEQRERELRNKLNAQFQNFVKKVDAYKPDKIEFDIPYRELGFYGVPHRMNVLLQPSVHCLVSLVEAPFFVMPIDEIEIAYFERISYGLKNFDLVFVKKDWKQAPVHISAISIESLESLRDWLDSVNIKYYQGPLNLNWKSVMSSVSKDPRSFWEDGGWDMLAESASSASSREEEDEEDEEEEKKSGAEPAVEGEVEEEEKEKPKKKGGKKKSKRNDDSEEGEDYNPSGSESEDYAYNESSSSGDSGDEEEYSDDDEGGDDDEESEEEDVSWDTHEKRAEASDMRKNEKRKRTGSDESDDEDRPKAKRVKK